MRLTHLCFTSIVLLSTQLAFANTELVKINSHSLSLEDFNKKYKESLKFFPGRTPTKRVILDELIKRELAVQEAKRLGLDKDPEIIERMNSVLITAAIEKRIGKDFEGIHIEDDAAQTYYNKNPDLRTSHIFIAVKPEAKPDEERVALEKIKKIQTLLRSNKMSFSEVAQKESEGVAAAMGGDIDFQSKDMMDPRYYEAALGLKTPGAVSDIVRSQFGYHIIKLTKIRPWLEADKGRVKRLLFEQTKADIYENFMTQLRKQAQVTAKYDLIKE